MASTSWEVFHKKFISMGLAVALLVSASPTAYAADEGTDTYEGSTSLSIEVQADQEILSVTLPTAILLQMSGDGSMITPTNAKIKNNVADRGIQINSIQVDLTSDWQYAVYSDNFATNEANPKQLGLRLKNDDMGKTGAIQLTAEDWRIAGDGELTIDIKAKVPRQKVAKLYENVAVINFNIGWQEGEVGGNEGGDPPVDPDPTPETKYTITFLTPEHGSLSLNSVETDSNGVIVNLPDVITEEGYAFKRFEDMAGNEVKVGDTITSNIELKAIFEEIPKPIYTITFRAPENGTLDSESVQTAEDGLIVNLPTPTPAEGYIFKRFENTSGNEIKVGDILTSDTELIAVFEHIPVQGTIDRTKARAAFKDLNATSLELCTGNKGSVQNNPIDISTAGDGSVILSTDGLNAYVYGAYIEDVKAPSSLSYFLNRNVRLQTIKVGSHLVEATDLQSSFCDLPSLTTLDLSELDVSKVTNVAYLVAGNDKLTNLTLWNGVAKVTECKFMLSQCSSLETFDCSKLDTSGVSSFYGMFDTCSKLQLTNLGSMNVSNATDMSYMFRNMQSMTSFDISNWNPNQRNIHSLEGTWKKGSTTHTFSDSNYSFPSSGTWTKV